MATQTINKPKAGALHAGVEQSTNKRCPAIILAASRTAKVIGRIKELIISIHTMNGTNTTGVPSGTKWAIAAEKFFTNLYLIIPAHSIILNGKVNLICLVLVNTNGQSPIKLLKAKTKNSDTLISFVELPTSLLFTRPTSSANPLVRRETLQSLRLAITHHEDGIKHTLKTLTQLIFIPATPVPGSKVLNSLPYIYIYIYIQVYLRIYLNTSVQNYQVFRVLKFKILYDNTPWYACRSMQLKE